MDDPRLNSIHLDIDPRRQDYRRARERLLASRGWMTMALEKASDLSEDSEVLPNSAPANANQFLPGSKSLLLEPSRHKTYSLRPGLNTIGRLADNDIVLEESVISRRHCVVLVHAGGQCELHDTASRNGTQLNGQVIDKPTPLHRGDHITVGKRLLVFIGESDLHNNQPNDTFPEINAPD